MSSTMTSPHGSNALPTLTGAVKVEKCIEAIVRASKLYGLKLNKEEEESCIAKTTQYYTTLVNDLKGNWAKVMKYKLSAFFSSVNKQPLAKNPFGPTINDLPHQILCGKAGRFIQAFLKKDQTREMKKNRLEYTTTILQLKKGMPRGTKDDAKQAARETFVSLTTHKIEEDLLGKELIPWGNYNDNIPNDLATKVNRPECIKQIRRTVHEVLKGAKYGIEDRIRPLFPSTSANYINSRGGGGAVGTILQDKELMEGLRKPGGWNKRKYEVINNEEHIEDEELTILTKQSELPYTEAYAKLWFRILKKAVAADNIAVLVGLVEPLKLRVISKHDPYIATVLHSLQKFIHNHMRKQKTFRLIGEYISERAMLDVLGANLGIDEEFLSGDYSDASNSIFSWASQAAANAVADELELSSAERKLYVDSLVNHHMENPDTELHQPQQSGQLMGSISSFPILCIINAAMCRWAYELSIQQIRTLNETPMLINGDDIAIRAKTQYYELWKTITSYVGLTESLGKTFRSREFVNMNSTNFQYDSEEPNTEIYIDERPDSKTKGRVVHRKNPYKLTRYINFGLLYGLKRSTVADLNDEKSFRLLNLGAKYRELMTYCPDNKREEVHNMFIEYHKEGLKATHLPWHIPEWLGGIGLTGFKKPTEVDLRVAHMILINWNKRDEKGKLSSQPVDPTPRKVTWEIWKKAEENVPTPNSTTDKNDPGIQLYNKTVGAGVIDLLFDSNYSLESIFKDIKKDEKEEYWRRVKHNKRLWNPASYKELASPLPDEAVLFRPIYNTYTSNPTKKYRITGGDGNKITIAASLD